MILPQYRLCSRRRPFRNQIPDWNQAKKKSWGSRLRKNLALSIWEIEGKRGGLCREGKLSDTKWNSLVDFALSCIALLFISKSLCKKWETESESFPSTHCEVKYEEENSLFYPPLFSSDDEHLLIQHYCQSLNQESPLSQPRSPAQILISLESEERGELERILADLEEENRWVTLPAATALETCCRSKLKLSFYKRWVCHHFPVRWWVGTVTFTKPPERQASKTYIVHLILLVPPVTNSAGWAS